MGRAGQKFQRCSGATPGPLRHSSVISVATDGSKKARRETVAPATTASHGRRVRRMMRMMWIWSRVHGLNCQVWDAWPRLGFRRSSLLDRFKFESCGLRVAAHGIMEHTPHTVGLLLKNRTSCGWRYTSNRIVIHDFRPNGYRVELKALGGTGWNVFSFFSLTISPKSLGWGQLPAPPRWIWRSRWSSQAPDPGLACTPGTISEMKNT